MFDGALRRRVRPAATLAVLCSGVLVAACNSDNSSAGSTSESGSVTSSAATPATLAPSAVPGSLPAVATPAPTAATTPAAPAVPTNADPNLFDPGSFADPPAGANKWLPLTAGYQSVREGAVNKGSRRLPHRRVYTVTDVTKEIDGVRAVLVLDQDFDGGDLAEQAIDYLAEDKQGNVWSVGSYTEAYEGGQFVNAADAWLAGVNGGRPGVLMMAAPTTDTPPYSQGDVPGEGSVTAEVIKTGESVCVPFQCYTDVLVIQEDGSENTYFAPGVGGIRLEPVSGDPQETEELINLTQLTPEGLAELSAEALRLDEHARSEASDVFGDSATAARTP